MMWAMAITDKHYLSNASVIIIIYGWIHPIDSFFEIGTSAYARLLPVSVTLFSSNSSAFN